MASAPPGFTERVTPAATAPPPPPGFTERVAASGTPDTGRTFMGSLLPTPEGRAFLSESARAVPQMVGDFARQQAGVTETHYRNLANLPYAPLGEEGLGLVDRPTPEAQSEYQGEVASGVLTAAGGLLGRGLGVKASDAVKYLGRGFRTTPGTERFLSREAAHMATGPGSRVGVGELVGPAVSGAAVAGAVDALDPTPYELTDKPVAGGAGVAAAAAAGRNTIDDMLLSNPRWRNVMMRPSAGTASAILGALLGYGASRGLAWSKDQITDAADYVSGLFEGEEQTK